MSRLKALAWEKIKIEERRMKDMEDLKAIMHQLDAVVK